MPRTLSNKNLERIENVKKQGVNLDQIEKIYGRRFAINLLRKLTRPKNCKQETTSLPFPQFKVIDETKQAIEDQYKQQVEDAGIKFRYWDENFVDEDTGEIVTIERYDVYYIGCQPSS